MRPTGWSPPPARPAPSSPDASPSSPRGVVRLVSAGVHVPAGRAPGHLVQRRVQGHRRQQTERRAQTTHGRRPQAPGSSVKTSPGRRVWRATNPRRSRPPAAPRPSPRSRRRRAHVGARRATPRRSPRAGTRSNRAPARLPGGVLEVREDHRRLRLDRSAAEDRFAGRDQCGEGRRGLLDRGLQRLVQHDTHGSVVVVMADQDDRASEVGVPQRRAGDQQVASERVHEGILPGCRPTRDRPAYCTWFPRATEDRMNAFSRGLRLAKVSWGSSSRTGAWLPVLSFGCSLVLTVLFAAGIWGVGPEGDSLEPVHYVLLFLYVALAFVTIFFNAAAIGMAMKRLRGEDATIRDGLDRARPPREDLPLGRPHRDRRHDPSRARRTVRDRRPDRDLADRRRVERDHVLRGPRVALRTRGRRRRGSSGRPRSSVSDGGDVHRQRCDRSGDLPGIARRDRGVGAARWRFRARSRSGSSASASSRRSGRRAPASSTPRSTDTRRRVSRRARSRSRTCRRRSDPRSVGPLRRFHAGSTGLASRDLRPRRRVPRLLGFARSVSGRWRR